MLGAGHANVRMQRDPGLHAVLDLMWASSAEIWAARAATFTSGEVSAVAGLKTALTLSPTGAGARPAFTASRAALRGACTVDCAISGARILQNLSISPAVVAAGNRPFLWSIGVLRTANASATAQAMITLRESTGAYEIQLQAVSSLWREIYHNGTNRTSDSAAVQDTSPHLLGALLDSTAGSSLLLDGVSTGAVAAGNTAWGGGGVNRMYVGTNAGAQASDYSFHVMGVCANDPGANVRVRLKQLARYFYGTA